VGIKVFHKGVDCEKPVEKGCGLWKSVNLIIHNISKDNKYNFSFSRERIKKHESEKIKKALMKV